MRLFGRSSRDEIMRGISFGKRGQILSPGSASSGGGAGHSTGGAQSSGRNMLMISLFLFGLVVVGVFIWGYLASANGQRAVQDVLASIKKYTVDPVSDFFAGVYSTGSGDYFATNINSSSDKKGIDLVDFRSLTGDAVPAGQAFDILYDIEYYNVPSSSTYEGDFYCYFNTSTKDTESNVRKDGEIISSNSGVIQKGATTLCRISGEQTQALTQGAYTVFGAFSFKTATKDASLPVYFIPGEVADQIGDTDFFDAYDLGISQGDLRVVYNGEPLSVGIGVGGEGEEQQPVIIRSGDTLSYNTVAITLNNEWNGNIKSFDSFTLYLPDGVTLNDELNGAPSVSCPFSSGGRDERSNSYTMDDSVKDSLFTNYVANYAFFGKSNYRTFQCWISVDPDIFADAPYVVKEYSVDIEYVYTVEEKQETVSIIQQGGSLVA